MAADDLPVADAQRLGRGDELALLQRQRLAAHDARHVEPLDGADGDEDEDEVAAEEDHQDDDQEDEGQRIEHLDQAHHDVVDAAAGEAGDGAVGDADERG